MGNDQHNPNCCSFIIERISRLGFFYDEATMKDVVMLLRESEVSEEGYKKFEQLCENNKQTFKCCVVLPNHEVYGGVKNYLRSQGNSVLALTRDALKEAYAYPKSINELTE